MTDINKQKLKKKLEKIYQGYIEGKNLKKETFQIYKAYSGASIFLDKDISLALNKLIDLYENTGIAVSKQEAKDIIKSLKKEKEN